MRVTVLMPTYNRLELFKRALESALSQNYHDMEILVMNNGCRDGTAEYLKTISDSRVRVITFPENRKDWINVGIQNAKGDILCQLHDDDLFYDNVSISCRVDIFNDPAIEVVYASALKFFSNGVENRIITAEPPDKDRIWRDEYTHFLTYMWRKSIHEKIGLFPAELLYQFDLWFKIATMMECKCFALDRLVIRYMVWHGQDSAHANRTGEIKEDSLRCMALLEERYHR